MPKEYYQLPINADLPETIMELNRVLDSISRRLNFISDEGDNTSFEGKKLRNLDTGVNNSDAIRLDQSILVGNEALTASRLLKTDTVKKLASTLITDFLTAGTDIEITADGSGGAEIASTARFSIYANYDSQSMAASGTKTITGVGFEPDLLIFGAASDRVGEFSIGFSSQIGPIHSCIYDNNNVAADTWISSQTYSMRLYEGAGVDFAALVSAWGADGFTLTFTRTGAKSGTLTFFYIAIKT